MSRDARITLDWADGTYTFRLGIGELEEHDEKTGRGPLEVLSHLVQGTWRVSHIRETIRLGLIGGGEVSAPEATKLVRRYVDAVPLLLSVPLAIAVLGAAVRGEPVAEEAEPEGKPEADPTTPDV